MCAADRLHLGTGLAVVRQLDYKPTGVYVEVDKKEVRYASCSSAHTACSHATPILESLVGTHPARYPTARLCRCAKPNPWSKVPVDPCGIRACHVSCRRLHAVYHASVGRRHHGACVHAIRRTLAPSRAGFVPAYRGESVHHRAWRVLRRRGQGQDGRRTRQVPARSPTRSHDVMPGRTFCALRAHAAGWMARAVLHVVWRC